MAVYHTTGKELRKSPKKLIAVLVALFAIGGTALGVLSIRSGLQDITTNPPEESHIDISMPSSSGSSDLPEDRVIYAYDVRFHEDIANGALVLVNRTYGIEDTEHGLVPVFEHKNEHYKVRDHEVLLQEEAVLALNEMTAAFYLATKIDDLQVTTGYRTKAYQQKLYDNYKPDADEDPSEMAAKGGHSDHESGYSVDFNIYRNGESITMDGTGDYAWLAEHCAEYGFILRYPESKVSETEFAYEPWHFRFVGKAHAMYMQQNDLSLEAYLNLLKNYTYSGTHLQITDAQGSVCEVFYVPANLESETTEIPVPATCEHNVSGNNTDGYIITVYPDRPLQPNNTTSAITDESTEAATQ
ncbi:MAG: M15 family metallopeptidase [Oscillospiraceae bacterium]|nr:M15 family metallopeptidase [Oscillospiraceae bacterium]